MSKKSSIHTRQRIERLDIILHIILSIWVLLILFPFYEALMSSLVNSIEFTKHPIIIWPQHFVLDNYRTIFDYTNLLNGYKNTLIVVLIGVPIHLFLTVSTGYVFSQDFPGRKILFKLALFTMFFSGGMIPTYILMRSMKMLNTYWPTILIGGVSTYYMIIIKGSFENMPEALKEAAVIDGATDMTVLFKIYLPLQLPMLATFTLFFTVGLWNSWYWPMITMSEPKLQVLPVILRQLCNTAQNTSEYGDVNVAESFGTGIKMAATILTMLPIMCFYPFLQKYFVKGVMVGSIKM